MDLSPSPVDSFLSPLMADLNKEQYEMEKYGLQSLSPKSDKAECRKVGLVPKGCSLKLTSPSELPICLDL